MTDAARRRAEAWTSRPEPLRVSERAARRPLVSVLLKSEQEEDEDKNLYQEQDDHQPNPFIEHPPIIFSSPRTSPALF